jgi:hypothetical protein
MYVKLRPMKKRWGLGIIPDSVDSFSTSIVDCMLTPSNPICGNPATASLPYGYEGPAVAMANLVASQYQTPARILSPAPSSSLLGGINSSYLLYGGVALLGLMIVMKAGRR